MKSWMRLAYSTAMCMAITGCLSGSDTDLEQLLMKHAEARGGASRLENLRTIRISLEISEPTFTVKGIYVATRDGYARIDIYAGEERVFSEALTPEGGWQLFRGETKAADMSPEGAQTLRRGLIGNLYALHELPAANYCLALTGRRQWAGKSYWAVDITAPDGNSKRIFIDPDSLLIAGEAETAALHPDVDATAVTTETTYHDHRVTAGIDFARRSEKRELGTGRLLQSILLEAVEPNADLDLAVFRRPE